MLHEFYIPGDLPERQHLRFRHYETRRRERIDCVLAERARIIQELIDDSSMSESVQGADRSEMLQRVASREAKRLEILVRKQIRRRAYVEKEKRKRSEKYGQLEAKLKAREAKVFNSEKLRNERAIELQAISLARFQVRDIMLQKTRDSFEEHQAVIRANQAAEEAKIANFLQEKQQRESALSEAYESRHREVAERQATYFSELNEKRKKSYSKKEERAFLASQKKQRVIHLQQLKGEEGTLRLIDALEKKRELERRDAEKREQIASLMNVETEKAFTFQYTKDEIINQRKTLATKTLGHASIGLDNITPGPAEYAPAYSSMAEIPGPKISVIKPKLDLPGTVDFALTHAASIPGPGNYDTKILPDGSKMWNGDSGLWGTSERTNFIDDDRRMKRDIPGPATYELISDGKPSVGPVIRRDLVNPSLFDWRETASASPGPASYTVDEFTRTEQLKKAVKLAPVIDI